MVSRRNFFTITAIMAVVFFLFQALNVAREHGNDYRINAFAGQDEALPPRPAAFSGDAPGREKVAYIGTENAALKEVAESWCLYTKRTFCEYRTLFECAGQGADILLLDGGYFNSNGGVETLLSYTEKGTTIIFLSLPDQSVIAESAALRQLLGIENIRGETDIAGVRLYPGLLLGGGAVYKPETEEDAEKYQDFLLDFPHYALAAGTKTYMCGIPADDTNDNEAPIIWRNSFANSKVFAVNGDYVSDAAGLGILTGFMAEAAQYELYPVVNARNMVIAGCPVLADENSEKIEAFYSMDMSGLFRDVIFPPLVSLNERCGMGVTFMLRTRFDYGGSALPDGENLEYYLKEINVMRGEAGISAADTPQDLLADAEFFRGEIPDFAFTSAYVDEEAAALPEYGSIRTAVFPYDGGSVIGYRDDFVTYQKALSDCFLHTYMDDFRLRSVMSALGYSCVLADMERAAYPETSADSWENLSKELLESVTAAPGCYDAFDGTTLTQSDERIRSFLALDYREAVGSAADVITLETSGGSDSAWFILRLHNRAVESVEGGNFTKIEDGAYLIEVRGESAEIRLCEADERYYYE